MRLEKLKSGLKEIDQLTNYLSRELTYLIVLIAVTGSLSVSTIYGWDTFLLSKAQRLLMYPLLPIIGLGIYLDRDDLRRLVLPLSGLGTIISAYHHLLVRFDPTQGCGFALPCTMQSKILILGIEVRPMYLPLSAFTAFGLVTAIIWRYEPKA